MKIFLRKENYLFKPFFIVPDIILRNRNLYTKHGYGLIIFGRVSVVREKIAMTSSKFGVQSIPVMKNGVKELFSGVYRCIVPVVVWRHIVKRKYWLLSEVKLIIILSPSAKTSFVENPTNLSLYVLSIFFTIIPSAISIESQKAIHYLTK